MQTLYPHPSPLPMERGCCRFSGFTTTACPLRVQGGELARGPNDICKVQLGLLTDRRISQTFLVPRHSREFT